MSKMSPSNEQAIVGAAVAAATTNATGWPTLALPPEAATRTGDSVMNGDHSAAIQTWAGNLQGAIANDSTAKAKAIADLQSIVDGLTKEIAAMKAAATKTL